MRKNTEAVMKAWEQGTPHRKADAIWTDGTHVYSYETCILADRGFIPDKRRWVMNSAQFSQTTGRQQSGIREYMGTKGHTYEEVPFKIFGATADALIRAASHVGEVVTTSA